MSHSEALDWHTWMMQDMAQQTRPVQTYALSLAVFSADSSLAVGQHSEVLCGLQQFGHFGWSRARVGCSSDVSSEVASCTPQGHASGVIEDGKAQLEKGRARG